jgi:thiol:disulfide interchange protein DsbD
MLKVKANFVLLVLFLGFISQGFAQVYEPVSWKFETTYTDDNKAELKFIATIEDGWHVYALNLPSEEGPIPTSFTLTPSDKYQLVGKVKQGKYKTDFDPNFDMDLNYFDKKATFTQTIDRKSVKDFNVEGFLTFMVCNDEMCLPPEDVEFKINVKGAAPATPTEPEKNPEPAFGSAAISPLDMGGSDQEGVLIPVNWTFSVENETDSTANLVFEATIDEGWYVYSQFVDTTIVPGNLQFKFENTSQFTFEGGVKELNGKEKFDPIFQTDVVYFEGKAKFVQTVRKNSRDPIVVKGYVTSTTCDGFKCLAPEEASFEFSLAGGIEAGATIGDDSETEDESRSNWAIFFISFFSGFAALLTPCVFPMIPMTVSYFTKTSKTRAAGIRNSIIYGLSIIVIYVVLGVVVTAIFGASILSELSTDPWFNLFFFALLIIFAVSFLGAFEITLPSSWINKADAQADRGGFIGIFFMAFTLALVSFSCTGPIVGTLIVEAAAKGGSAPAIGMLGFSLAIALPFTLFAAFPGWLNSLPQSGGWLNSVKVTLGFLELAFAFKFLSNADMVLQWHLLEREVYLAIWIVIFAMLTFYLLGKLKLAHDSDLPYISVTRIFLALITGAFTVYLLPGLWGAPLKLISAFPPPLQYSESPQGVGYIGGGGGAPAHAGEDTHVGPQGIFVYHDYEKGLAKAKELGIPAMLDFTGHACVNCRKMEMQVWSDPEIKRKLSEDVLLISLYVDERTELPEEEQIEVELTGGRKKKLRNVGNKWAAFQEINYGINAQPYYVLLDHNEKQLLEPANYQDYGTIDKFDDWLSRGLEAFEKKK